MAGEKDDKIVKDIDDEKFFQDILDDPDEDEVEKQDDEGSGDSKGTDDDEKKRSQKNKDAEEARKRREAEEKAQKALEEKNAKEKAEAEKQKKYKDKQVDSLGKQLDTFKQKNPDVDLKELDNDKSFKRFIDGKLLGKKDFGELYNEYVEMRSEMTGKSEEDVQANYRTKANASSGSTKSKTVTQPEDVFNETEYNSALSRIPFMAEGPEKDALLDKLDKTTEYYTKKN